MTLWLATNRGDYGNNSLLRLLHIFWFIIGQNTYMVASIIRRSVMRKAFAALVLISLSLVSVSSHAQSSSYIDEDEMPVPQYPTYRCCAKPATHNDMSCVQGVDKLQAWGKAVYICEYKYGKGNCVSRCYQVKTK